MGLLQNRLVHILLIFVFIPLTVCGQHVTKAFISKHNLQNLTARTSYQNLIMDRNGLMYIATSDGVYLYNGASEQFIVNSENAGFHIVTSMVEDAQGTIWVGCEDGVIFRIINKKMSVWLPQEGLPKHKICQMLVDDKNQLWIATKGEGVYVYNQKYLYHFGYEDGLKRLEINDMVFIKDKGVLISSDLGLQLLNFFNEKKVVGNYEMNCIRDRDIVQDLDFFENELFLNDLSKGIIRQVSEKDCELVWQNKSVEMALAMTASKNYQVFLTDRALYLNSSRDKKVIKEKHSISLAGKVKRKGLVIQIADKNDFDLTDVQSIIMDDNNTLWILLKNKGLMSVFLPIIQYTVAGKTVHDIAMSSNGMNLLLCTDSGLQVIDVTDGRFISQHFQGENITTIFADKNPEMYWIGSYGKGLIRFNLVTKESKRFKKENGLPDNSILQITGNKYYIWITTLGGLMRIDHNGKPVFTNQIIYSDINGLPTNFIYRIAPDSNYRIWMGTDGNGINYMNKDAYCIDPLYNSTRTQSIYNLVYDGGNFLYFNSSGQGLGLLDITKDSITWIETPMKNMEYECISLINDSVLIGAGNGFMMLSDPTRSMSITMDEEFGLTEIVPALNAIFKDEYNNTWIGCRNAVIRIEDDILSILSRPHNSFNNIRVNNSYIEPGKDSVFDYSQNQIVFEFNAIHHLASDHLDYRYMLEGYEKDWVYSKEGYETYSRLLPGNYRFVIQSSIDKHFDSSNEISYSFVILKPFWKRWWFLTICGLAIVFLLQYIQKRRVLYKTRQEAIRRKTTELEFEILKSQVNPHFLFNSFNSVISLIEDDKDKAIEFTEKLSDYFRNILKYRNVHLIPLHEELTILLNYLGLLKLRYPDQFTFEQEHIQQNALIAPMTLQLLMENAIKHNDISSKFPMKITVYCEDDVLIFRNSVRRKTYKVESTGFGLDSIRFRYNLFTDKEIKIEESADYFSVKIPLMHKQV